MSNRQKAEFVSTIFVYKFPGEVPVKFCQNPGSYRKVQSAPEILIQQPVEFPTAITRKLPTVSSCLTDHQKDEGVAYQFGIWYFRSFGKSKAQKFSSVQPLFCPEQNLAVTSIVKIPYCPNRKATESYE
jgi:hypothetical protein